MFKKLIFTSVTIRVLRFLSEDPASSFHSRQVAKRARVSSGAASLTLRSLHRSKLLELDRKGGMKFYRVDLSNPVARQFKVLFNLLFLEELVLALKEHTERVTLFGSSGEGTDGKHSDMDLFVLTTDAARAKGVLRMFQKRLNRKLSPIIVDAGGLARLRRDDPTLYENISRGILLWQRE